MRDGRALLRHADTWHTTVDRLGSPPLATGTGDFPRHDEDLSTQAGPPAR